jgi:F0F1-type ATP synthase membrane subunit b/b'/DNA-directed RNA polymerase subunit RPC12/RpoP
MVFLLRKTNNCLVAVLIVFVKIPVFRYSLLFTFIVLLKYQIHLKKYLTMLNFFSNKKNNDASNSGSNELKKELDEREQRWYTFLKKLEERYDELIAEINVEAPKIYEEDSDTYKRAYLRFKSGMEGQLDMIRRKAQDTAQAQIHTAYNAWDVSILSPDYRILSDWRIRCLDCHNAWDERIYAKREAAFKAIERQEEMSLEEKYADILREYENLKEKFGCVKCGSALSIDKLYTIAAYITCPYCQTQNTFEPGAKMRNLPNIARPLAEQRVKTFHNEYLQNTYTGRYDDIGALREGKANEIKYYQKYLRAMFDEMNKILPDQQTQNEAFYERLLSDYKRTNS